MPATIGSRTDVGVAAPGRNTRRPPSGRWGGARLRFGVVALLLPLWSAGCSSYVSTSAQVRALVQSGEYDQALDALGDLESGGSRLLYLYERGLILHQQNRFAESNEAFGQAEELFEDLYTRSVSREAGALLVNESVREYRGERFEAALVHYYRVMNYLNLGDLESAAVQCRRLDHRLDVLSNQEGASFTDDAFLRYLAGMVYLENGDRNDADVSLRKALEGYRDPGRAHGADLPSRLYCDLAANAAALGAPAEARDYRDAGECDAPAPDAPRPGTLRLFVECGSVAFQSQADVVLPILKNEIHDDLDQEAYARVLAGRYGQPVASDVEVDYLLRISMPVLVETPSGIRFVRVGTVGCDTAAAPSLGVLGMDVTDLARRSFEEEQPLLLLRAVARGLAKYLAKEKAEKEGGEAAGLVVNILGLVTETADTRCWSTLPEKILLAQLDLAPGTYTIRVDLLGPDGRLDDRFEIPDVAISGGRSTFVNYRVY